MTSRHSRRALQPTRKTTDVTINGECWHPIVQWLNECHHIDPTTKAPFLFIDWDAEPGIRQLLRKTRQLGIRDDVNLRLSHLAMDALGRQVRFWESCPDELHPRFRHTMPYSGYFQEMALDIEFALWESSRRLPEAT